MCTTYQSPGFPFDEAASAALGARYYDRAYTPTGLIRQWNALLRGPLERREAMAKVTVPVAVIHGRGDQSLHWSAALETAPDGGTDIELAPGVEMIMPGDNVNIDVELITPIAIEQGQRFAIREGGHTVGAGVITEVIG